VIKGVLFDLDGTLFDSSPGIFSTANHTMRVMGFPECYDKSVLRKFIGPPLRECFKITFGTEEKYLDECVRVYREEYRKSGMHMVSLYPGMLGLLHSLKEMGIKLGVCTLKYDKLAKDIFSEQGLAEAFDVIKGTDEKGKITKSMCILSALSELGIERGDALMVGDTANDYNGAKEASVPFVGVTWGFGFEKGDKLCVMADEPNDILNLIIKRNGVER